ncbi:lysine--tRNA ligase [Actinorhabdospora filicis]|uniref:Lysine--tRNA ligase n=1 Tax=Actinorhabdospora filicis TaxID=1785913 RepID=A0A9W6SGF8_9ACTN|nr:bifunctional lysylphosphatidylglycerol synthetase/lysine--tRNA ligase LysX [Actinorhabdospora filicis]GLZ75555.1 lysine--tRNA ligase [Actinorhabdospora filicis]
MSTGEKARTEGWLHKVPKVFAGLLTIVAALSALAAVGGAFRQKLGPVRTAIEWVFVPVPANLAYAAFLAIIAMAVARRKRLAWWILTLYFFVQLGLGMLLGGLMAMFPTEVFTDEGGETIETPKRMIIAITLNLVITLLAVVILLVARREFNARVQRASLWKAVGTYVGLFALFTLLGWLLLNAFPGHVDRADRLPYVLERMLGGVFRHGNLGHAPGWVNLFLGLFGAIALFASLFTLFGSQRQAAVHSPEEEVRLRVLLARDTTPDSLGYFATRRDKSLIFSPRGDAAIGYRTLAGICLAAGDPIGEPADWPGAINAWLEHTRAYGWSPAVLGAGEEAATAYAAAGLRVREIGDEAILHPRDYSLEGADMRPVRQAVARVRRAGYTARIRRHRDLTPVEMRATIDRADAWRDTSTERGFSMALSRLGDPDDGDSLLVEAVDADGRVRALLSFVPWGDRGLSLDLMRRDRDGDNGLMEFMVSALCEEAFDHGVERISLNFAMFRAVFEEGARIGAGPILRAWRGLLLFFSRWWQLESLYRSNLKYRPQWLPRYLCYGERRTLPKVGMAAAIAEGFVTMPSRRVSIGRAAAPMPLPGLAEALAAASVQRESAGTGRAALPEQMRVRLDRLDMLRASGVDPYPVGFDRTATCAAVAASYVGLPPDMRTGEQVRLTGRVMLMRHHGRLTFATVRDWSGDLQLMLTGDAGFAAAIDIGDHVGVAGEIITTRRGELSVHVTEWTLTAKCLRPLPDKHKGLSDPEAKVRQRHLDLIVDAEAREVLRARAAVLHSLRTTLHDRAFLEVETPILQRVHGGANARPFVTHINAYDMRLYLRIAPELYLKRLCVGGVERVFELGRTFRNEGVSFKHNPEFTMLEAYQAYTDYHGMRELTETLVREAARAAFGTTVIERDGVTIDLAEPWPVLTVHGAISAALGEEIDPGTSLERLRELAEAAKVPLDPKWGPGAVVLEMYERLVEHDTTTPTFYTDFPTEVSPLTRQHRLDPRLAERWDLVAFGTELGTAYSELIDPVEQRRRLTAQSLLAAGGDPEAMELDEDFLSALEYAMPPTGGLGIGVDRLVMFLTGRTIRETLPFPLVRASEDAS